MIYLLSPVSKKETIHLPMISFSLCEERLELNDYDLLMFTSKQAVLSVEALNPQWKNISCLAIGKATAKQIESLGGTVAYCPESFYGETLSREIIEKFKNKNILYIRPKVISFDSKGFLHKEGIEIDEKIIYETSCVSYNEDQKPPKKSTIIFTSPSTIHCFLKSFEWDSSYIAVVIGEATKAHLPKNAHYEVADSPLITSCIEKAKQILNPNKL
ncbi:MAG: Uroporphyrinogen-III synthase (EC [uncultured Sulfurovum sp.]|uniref:Uroporphyrinogen-III synthase n=1 Tax=uncultured Sulfurovum sp. TaxID=269237 RepID=A0A6S6TB11_9BACT|nr:MAG: Uroporphyrinogen-III synthase (EC [uncultured Sulfurovum sp.]